LVAKITIAERVFAAVVAATGCMALAATTTVTQTISATFAPIAKLTVPANLTLSNTGTVFNAYTGTLNVSYWARTVVGGSMTMKVTTDFAAGGPSTASGDLTYTCSGATLGTACGGSITASATTSTSVLTLPASSCTGTSCGNTTPNTMSLGFTLADNANTKTGSYTATVQFTVSAT
jgi:hypothetical protein